MASLEEWKSKEAEEKYEMAKINRLKAELERKRIHLKYLVEEKQALAEGVVLPNDL